MRYDVLGPLRIRDDRGESIAVSSAKQRLVLAFLLQRPNQPVSTDRFLDLLWTGTPPRTARTNLQVYVHRLRQVLGDSRIQHGSRDVPDRPDRDDRGTRSGAGSGAAAAGAGDSVP